MKKTLMMFFILLGGLFLALQGCRRGSGPRETAQEADSTLHVLLVGDPFALALEKIRPQLEKQLGRDIRLEIVGYNDGRRLALLNARDQRSAYDLIALDIVWLGEYQREGMLLDLTDAFGADRERFLQAPWEASSMDGRIYALPIQPHAELLWVRTDLLSENGKPIPRTTEEVLATARALHRPEAQQYGIAWNAQRGQPLGQTMAHFFAAFGQPILDDQGRPAFRTERGLAAARYAKALMEVSPPDILNMAWDQRTSRFASGQAAMTYGWAARAYMTEDHPASRVRGLVAYAGAPHAPGVNPVTPVGVWSLGIPANVASRRRSEALLRILMSDEIQEALMLAGNTTPPLLSTMMAPGVLERFPALAAIHDLDQRGELDFSMRPRIPEWDSLSEILGTSFHEMLSGRLSAEEALDLAYRRALELTGFAEEAAE